MYYLTEAQRRLFIILSWADWMQVFITLGLTKISICLFLLRIIESRRLVKGMYVLIGFTALFSAVSFFVFIGVCRPLRAYWDVGVDGHCLSNTQIEATIIAQGSKLDDHSIARTVGLQCCLKPFRSLPISFVQLFHRSSFAISKSACGRRSDYAH